MHIGVAEATIADRITPILRQIANAKYRFKTLGSTPPDVMIEVIRRRVAPGVAEKRTDRDRCESAFYKALADSRFLPAGRFRSSNGADQHGGTQLGLHCPGCSQLGLVREAGSVVCTHGGWSRCS